MRALRFALAFALLTALAASAAARWDAVRGHVGSFDWRWGLVALIGVGLVDAVACLCWRRWLLGLGQDLPYAQAFRIMYQANLAKYVPGGAWHLVGRAAMCEAAGVPAEAALASMALDTACHVATAAIVGVPVVVLAGGVLPGLDPRWLVAGAVAALAALHPRLVAAGLAVVARITGRAAIGVPVGYPFLLGQALLYAANWALLALAVVAFGQAWHPAPLGATQAGMIAGGLLVAWVLGAITVVAPAGLGVREAGLALLLAPFFPPGWPAVFAVATRLLFMAVEGLFFIVAARFPQDAGTWPPSSMPGGSATDEGIR